MRGGIPESMVEAWLAGACECAVPAFGGQGAWILEARKLLTAKWPLDHDPVGLAMR